MFPKNEYTLLIEEKLKNIDFKNAKIFKYNPDPQVLTGEIEKVNKLYTKKKKSRIKKKMLEDKDDEASVKELERLEQLYTIGSEF